MENREGETLLNQLIEHATKPEFIDRHQWKAGDFLLWDNCSVQQQQQAVADYKLPLRRHRERATLTGTAPF